MIKNVLETEKIPNVYGDMEWCITTICYMLKNEKYCGKDQIEVYLRGGSIVKQKAGKQSSLERSDGVRHVSLGCSVGFLCLTAAIKGSVSVLREFRLPIPRSRCFSSFGLKLRNHYRQPVEDINGGFIPYHMIEAGIKLIFRQRIQGSGVKSG